MFGGLCSGLVHVSCGSKSLIFRRPPLRPVSPISLGLLFQRLFPLHIAKLLVKVTIHVR